MIEKAKFLSGLHALGLAFGKVITPDVVRIFDGVLSDKFDDSAWEKAVRRALESETFFPPPAVLLRYGMTDATPPTAQAGHAYLGIVNQFEDGHKLGFREVSEKFGRAAAEAFMAAGGYNAFTWCEPQNEPFRRRDFTQAYVEMVEAEPLLALPVGSQQHQIESGLSEPERAARREYRPETVAEMEARLAAEPPTPPSREYLAAVASGKFDPIKAAAEWAETKARMVAKGLV